MNTTSHVTIATIQPNQPLLGIKTAVDSHFDPGHALIAVILLVGSILAYTKLLAK